MSIFNRRWLCDKWAVVKIRSICRCMYITRKKKQNWKNPTASNVIAWFNTDPLIAHISIAHAVNMASVRSINILYVLFFNSPLLLGAGQRLIVSIYYNCSVHCALWNDDKQNATERNFSWSLWPDLWHYYIHYHREDSFSFHEKCTATFITPLRFGRIIFWW